MMIVPKRKRASSELCKKTERRGSPLLYHTVDLVPACGRPWEKTFTSRWRAVRKKPNIESALTAFQKAGVSMSGFSLYPQHSFATTIPPSKR